MRGITAAVALILLCSSLAFGDQLFNRVCTAIKEKDTSLEGIKNRYEGRPISGKGYLVKIRKNYVGNAIAHVSTEQDFGSPLAVMIMVIFKKEYNDRVFAFQKGDQIRFSGVFYDLRLKMVVVKEAEIA